MVVYLNGMEDGLQHRENITEKEVPGLCQRVEQLLTCINHTAKIDSLLKLNALAQANKKS